MVSIKELNTAIYITFKYTKVSALQNHKTMQSELSILFLLYLKNILFSLLCIIIASINLIHMFLSINYLLVIY